MVLFAVQKLHKCFRIREGVESLCLFTVKAILRPTDMID
jgi:hypothetical protein